MKKRIYTQKRGFFLLFACACALCVEVEKRGVKKGTKAKRVSKNNEEGNTKEDHEKFMDQVKNSYGLAKEADNEVGAEEEAN